MIWLDGRFLRSHGRFVGCDIRMCVEGEILAIDWREALLLLETMGRGREILGKRHEWLHVRMRDFRVIQRIMNWCAMCPSPRESHAATCHPPSLQGSPMPPHVAFRENHLLL